MKRILVVDEDRQVIEQLTQLLSTEGLSVQSAGDAESALHRVKAWKPHLIFLDAQLKSISDFGVVPKIRAATERDYTAVVVLSKERSLPEVDRALRAGADDFLDKPLRPHAVVARVRMMLRFKEAQDQLRRTNERIEELSATDELTGLLSFRTLFRRGEEEILRARRFKKVVSALIVNLDRFSAVNQASGFQFGTQVLQDAAKRLKKCIRNIDMVARIGADEFFIVLVETDLAGAEFVAERIRDALRSEPFKTDKLSASLSACIGISGIGPEQGESRMSDLIHSASEALRSAKAAGADSIETYSFS